jgi:hypothetical protein
VSLLQEIDPLNIPLINLAFGMITHNSVMAKPMRLHSHHKQSIYGSQPAPQLSISQISIGLHQHIKTFFFGFIVI